MHACVYLGTSRQVLLLEAGAELDDYPISETERARVMDDLVALLECDSLEEGLEVEGLEVEGLECEGLECEGLDCVELECEGLECEEL